MMEHSEKLKLIDKKHLLLWCLCILNQKSLFLCLYLLLLFSTLLLEPLIHTLYYLFHFNFYRSEQVKNNMLILTQIVKDLPAIRETWVRSLDQKDPLEKGMATHPNILAWRIPWAEEACRLQSMGSQRVGHDWVTNTANLYVCVL